MSKVLFISEQQIKSQSIIETNVDGKVLSKAILNAQETHLKGILGVTLYDALIAAVEAKIASGTALSPAHETLLNQYIQPYLINLVVADFILMNQYKVTAKGLLKMNDNSANGASIEEVEHVRDHFQNIADGAKSQLIKYLKENNLVGSNDQHKTDTNTTSSSIGWYLN